MDEVVALFLGAFLAGIVGIVTASFNRWRNVINEKKLLCRGLKDEIDGNQRLLGGMVTSAGDLFSKYYEQTDVIFDMNEMQGVPNILKPLHFERNIFSDQSSKLGLLEKGTIEKLIRYYTGLLAVEIGFQLLTMALYGLKDKQERLKIGKKFLDSVDAANQAGESIIKELEMVEKRIL
jgi:hypothetical protein